MCIIPPNYKSALYSPATCQLFDRRMGMTRSYEEAFIQRLSAVRRASLVFLYVIPFLVLPMLAYRPGKLALYVIAWGTQTLLITGAIWILAGNSVNSAKSSNRVLLFPGILLIACDSSASLGAYMGPPPWPPAASWVATLDDQHMRYVALLVAGLLSWAGFGLLTARLREAGERTYSVLGLSVTAISTPLFILFNLAALTVYDMQAAQAASSGRAPEWSRPLVALSLVWLGVYAVLTHLAVALYATALANVGLLGKFGRSFFVILGTIAAVSALVAVGAGSSTLKEAFFPFMIPAVPLILPYLMGVSIVRRAGDSTPN